LGKR
jgi:hypothetical protein